MSYSNTDTGSKPADPYKIANKENDISTEDKIADLNDFISKCKFCMMTTREASTGNLVSRCMALAAQENGGVDLIFHTNTESGKTDNISSDPQINLGFLNSSGEWASLSGTSRVLIERPLIKRYYSPVLKGWLGDLGDGKHDGGPDDPRIGVIKVEVRSATYAAARKSAARTVADIAHGTITGKVPEVNKLREISEEEITKWRGSKKTA